VLKRRKEYCGLEIEELSISALEDRYNGVVEE